MIKKYFAIACLISIPLSCAITGTMTDSDCQSENYILKKRVKLIERRNNLLENENLEQRNKIKSLEDISDKLAREYAQYKVSCIDNIEKLNDKRKKIKKELDMRILQLQKDIEDNKQNHASILEKLIKDARENEIRLTDEIRTIKVNAAEKEKKSSEEIAAYKDKISEKEKIISDNETAINANKAAIDDLKKNIELKDSEIKKLSESLEDKNNTIKVLNETVENLKKTISQLKSNN